MKISQILDKIDEHQLYVPAFQREFVWKRENVKRFMDSLIKEYPIGTLLTWETRNPPELKGDLQYDEKQGAVKILLDGQQRVTSLYLLIRNKEPPYYKKQDITHDPSRLYINVETNELQYLKKLLMENNPVWVNLTEVFQKKLRARNVINALEEKGHSVSREQRDNIEDNFENIQKILERNFKEQEIPVKATINEAIDIFYIVNASGVNLTEAELALAQISGYWPNARKRLKEKLSEMADHGFVFNLDFLIYALLGVLYQSGSEMQKLHSSENFEKIQAAWQRLEDDTLDYVINIMKTQAYVDHTKEINSVYALIPIIVYVYQKGNVPLTQIEIRKIVKWFYYSQIRNRYISQLPQKLDKDTKIAANSENPFDDLLNIIALERNLEITTDEFEGRDIRSPMFSLMRWYFKSRNAICFTKGVGLRKNMGKKYSLENDHIFPYSLLKKSGYSRENAVKYRLAQEFTNRAILTQVANRIKSNQPAYDYLSQVEKTHPAALQLQSIPTNKELWKIDNYEQFLHKRRSLLANELNTFLQNLAEISETEVEVTIEDLVVEGESEDLEFKETLRWNVRENVIDKKMEYAVLKTIAAFSNCDGGSLLIGVDDEGQILGLENDFRSLNGNKDEFELHLRNLFNKNFGKIFTISNIQIMFPMIDEKEICKIVVRQGSDPIHLEFIDKNGVGTQKFYVRSGNSSQELPPREASEYILQRFQKIV